MESYTAVNGSLEGEEIAMPFGYLPSFLVPSVAPVILEESGDGIVYGFVARQEIYELRETDGKKVWTMTWRSCD